MASVTLTQIDKIYPGEGKNPAFHAVKGIDLEIRDREFMVLVGPSGCGKSTTLRMIAGLEEISGGTIQIGDRTVNDIAPKERDIAMVFQNYALYPHMSVYDNMAFGLKLQKMPRDEIKARVGEAAEILGLTDLLKRKPKALSGGQRQRVALGRAIVRKPKVFLFDEPLSNLDAKMRVQMRAEISKLHRQLDATMIYVTHDQTEAMTMGDRITVMNHGDIMQVDEPLSIYARPVNQFVASFIGSPPMNFIEGTIKENGDGGIIFEEQQPEGGSVNALTLTGHLAAVAKQRIGGKVTLGVRPEFLSPVEDQGSSELAFRVQVEVTEPMGAETFLYLTTGVHSLIMRIDSSIKISPETYISLQVDMGKAHMFDSDSGEILLPE